MLPIEAVLPELKAKLARARAAVLEAPPGAGKTTLVPLALRDEPWAQGKKIIMLEPRRVAARAAAARMADLIGERVGETVGYRVRLDSKIGAKTRIEVVTEGLLTRRLQSDPALDGVGLLIFDEFHERSLNADLGLALALETQSALNENLKILVMSATLDGARVAKLLGDAPVIRSEGRLHPIDTRYVIPPTNVRIEHTVASVIHGALEETEGGILVFLPGEGEIRTVERLLADDPPRGATVLPLYGAMSPEAQDRAIRPLAGTRKIVLATAIAETSLTIEDVRVVIDSGQQRLARYDPATGMTRLVTQRVSLASADQRRGRAGRVAPGVCHRLWSENETRALLPFTPPEILTSDLAPFALDLAAWGEHDASRLALLDPPPPATFAEAQELLRELDAIDTANVITPHGRAMLTFGAHPRLAHMMIKARDLSLGASGTALAAILGERDVIRTGRNARDADLRLRLEAFAGDLDATNDVSADRGALARAREQARIWRGALGVKDARIDSNAAGRLTALAYPDRLAKRRRPGSFRLANGRGAVLPDSDPLAAQDFLAVAALDGAGANARIHQAAPITLAEIEEIFAEHIQTTQVTAWDSRERVVIAREEEQLYALTLADRPLKKADPANIAAAVLTGIRELGLRSLPWTDDLEALRARTAFVRRLDPEADWPDLSDDALSQSLEHWLQPFLQNVTRASDFGRIDLSGALSTLFDWEKKKRLDALAPTHITVPSGSHVRIDYSGETPVLAVRLQEMFGLADTPTVAGGRVPLTLHLLSPARRPVQVTRDLKSFWANGYPEVKRDLKGRYPKHHWPDDPWTATPTARAKPRR
ncbi:MAG: ATP-dependent helicase HrpB [Alphaproteobacteria bacterium]|nr:ATP-dependent helicase HrpB [Alphaproteobacteria bacterium]